VRIDGEVEQTVKIAREIAYSDVLIAVSHPTGHVETGLGGCCASIPLLGSRTFDPDVWSKTP
ncbi:MAG: hypothetical protein ACM3ZC_05505, partial [Bacteroidota bacterium]